MKELKSVKIEELKDILADEGEYAVKVNSDGSLKAGKVPKDKGKFLVKIRKVKGKDNIVPYVSIYSPNGDEVSAVLSVNINLDANESFPTATLKVLVDVITEEK